MNQLVVVQRLYVHHAYSQRMFRISFIFLFVAAALELCRFSLFFRRRHDFDLVTQTHTHTHAHSTHMANGINSKPSNGQLDEEVLYAFSREVTRRAAHVHALQM